MSGYYRIRGWIDGLEHPKPFRVVNLGIQDILDSDTQPIVDASHPSRSPSPNKRKPSTAAAHPSSSPGKVPKLDRADSPAPPSSSNTGRTDPPSNLPSYAEFPPPGLNMSSPLPDLNTMPSPPAQQALDSPSPAPQSVSSAPSFPPGDSATMSRPPSPTRSTRLDGKSEGKYLPTLKFMVKPWTSSSLNHRRNGDQMHNLLKIINRKINFSQGIMPQPIHDAFSSRVSTEDPDDVPLDEVEFEEIEPTPATSPGLIVRSAQSNFNELMSICNIVRHTHRLHVSTGPESEWYRTVSGPLLEVLEQRLKTTPERKFHVRSVQNVRFRTDHPDRKATEMKPDYVIVLEYAGLSAQTQSAVNAVMSGSKIRSCNHISGLEPTDTIVASFEIKPSQSDPFKSFHQNGYSWREWVSSILDLKFRDPASRAKLDWPPLLAVGAQSRTWDVYIGDVLATGHDFDPWQLNMHELQAFGGSSNATTVLKTVSILEDLVTVVTPHFERFYQALAGMVEAVPNSPTKSKSGRSHSRGSSYSRSGVSSPEIGPSNSLTPSDT